ncbi:MAG: hypothetical protein CK429_01555 [Mycobacterium sp.]|nr:MAG: hypothetical protein CK429_01555 [Mycobacterium sp.]
MRSQTRRSRVQRVATIRPSCDRKPGVAGCSGSQPSSEHSEGLARRRHHLAAGQPLGVPG